MHAVFKIKSYFTFPAIRFFILGTSRRRFFTFSALQHGNIRGIRAARYKK